MIPGAFIEPLDPLSTTKRAWQSPQSCVVSVLTFLPLSSSTSLAVQRYPSTPFFPSIPFLDSRLAPHQSRTAPGPIIVIAIVLLHILVVACFAFGSPSHAEMASNSESTDMIHTRVVCRNCLQQRLAPISMREVLSTSGWDGDPFSWAWRWSAWIIIVLGPNGVIVVIIDAGIAALPQLRAYSGGGDRIDTDWGSWGHQMCKTDLKRRVSSRIIKYTPLNVHETDIEALKSGPCTIEGGKRQERVAQPLD